MSELGLCAIYQVVSDKSGNLEQEDTKQILFVLQFTEKKDKTKPVSEFLKGFTLASSWSAPRKNLDVSTTAKTV